MKSVPDQLLSKFSPHAMLDYLFQHFYSTLAIVAFFIAILILRACGKRGRRWIPVSTAPFGCMAFLVVFLLLTAWPSRLHGWQPWPAPWPSFHA